MRGKEQGQITKLMLEHAKRNIKLLTDGGVTITMSTDCAAVGRATSSMWSWK